MRNTHHPRNPFSLLVVGIIKLGNDFCECLLENIIRHIGSPDHAVDIGINFVFMPIEQCPEGTLITLFLVNLHQFLVGEFVVIDTFLQFGFHDRVANLEISNIYGAKPACCSIF
jgi:hypothetical protein